MSTMQIAHEAKKASQELLSLNEEQRIFALESIALTILTNIEIILKENKKDLKLAQASKLSSSIVDRLTLTENSLIKLAHMCLDIADQPQVIGMITEQHTRSDGLVIQKERIPLGVIGMIFESRPNVIIDGAALAIKSGNAIILKGGKEAHNSNRILFEIVRSGIENILPVGSVGIIENRQAVNELLKLSEFIDLMVPRGGSQLIQYVKENATMPVVAHDKGLCHIYVHQDADDSIVIPIILNSKTQRPGVCNAVETLLLHQDYPENKKIIEALIHQGVETRGCAKTQKLNQKVKLASLQDYETEYLDKIISVKIVKNELEAIHHIQKYSSHHTEAILTRNEEVSRLFLNSLDASCLVINASTRFNDGGELGLGAELGISTSKLHAYGPMGAKEMTTTRFLIKGSGQTR